MKKAVLKTQFIALLFLLIGKATFAQWSKVAMVDSIHESRPTTFILGDTIYMGRGDTGFFLYNKAFWGYTTNSKTWLHVPTYPGQGSDWGYSFVNNKTAYVGGGAGYGYFNDFWKYTPSGGWVSLGTGPGGLDRGYAVAFTINGNSYVGTGSNGSPMNDFWEYDTLSNTWTQKTSFPSPRLGAAAFEANGYGYAGLGGDNTGKSYRDMYRYDPVNDVWDTMAPMPSDSGMEEPAFFTLCGKLIVTCGDTVQSGSHTTKQAWLFDPTIKPKGRWHRLTNFPGPLPAYAPGGFAFNDTGYVYGGYTPNGNYYWAHMYSFVPTALNMSMIVSPVDTTICSGNSVTLSGSGATSYLWNTTDTTFSVLVAPKKDTIYTVSESNGTCVFIDTVHVTITPGASVNVTPDPALVCNGQTITLTASGDSAYQWVGTTDSTDTITVNPKSDTTYELLASNGSCTLDTLIAVKSDSASPFNILPLDTAFCNGQSTILYVSGGGSGFVWTPITGISDSTISLTLDSITVSPTVTTTYMVVGNNSNGCASSGADVVTVIPSPNKPTFSQNGNVLTSSSKFDNQWYRNDTLLVNDTSQNLTITIPGEYWVVVNNEANGCSTSSDSMQIKTGINQLLAISYQLSIYPNPFSNSIFIKINSSAENVNDWNLLVTDVLGRTLYSRQSLNYNNEIDLSNLSSGVYFITVINKTGRAVVPVVKQN